MPVISGDTLFMRTTLATLQKCFGFTEMVLFDYGRVTLILGPTELLGMTTMSFVVICLVLLHLGYAFVNQGFTGVEMSMIWKFSVQMELYGQVAVGNVSMLNPFWWTSIIRWYALYEDEFLIYVISMYNYMEHVVVRPASLTFYVLLMACGVRLDVNLGEQLHAHTMLIGIGFQFDMVDIIVPTELYRSANMDLVMIMGLASSSHYLPDDLNFCIPCVQRNANERVVYSASIRKPPPLPPEYTRLVVWCLKPSFQENRVQLVEKLHELGFCDKSDLAYVAATLAVFWGDTVLMMDVADGVFTLAKDATVFFQRQRYVICLHVLRQPLQRKSGNSKARHNIVVTGYYCSGCSDMRKLLNELGISLLILAPLYQIIVHVDVIIALHIGLLLTDAALVLNDAKKSASVSGMNTVTVLFPPARFEALMLNVVDGCSWFVPQADLLFNCDFTATLILFISNVINFDQLRGWYKGDDDVAGWKKVNTGMYLHEHCFVSDPNFLSDPDAEFRNHIWVNELHLILKVETGRMQIEIYNLEVHEEFLEGLVALVVPCESSTHTKKFLEEFIGTQFEGNDLDLVPKLWDIWTTIRALDVLYLVVEASGVLRHMLIDMLFLWCRPVHDFCCIVVSIFESVVDEKLISFSSSSSVRMNCGIVSWLQEHKPCYSYEQLNAILFHVLGKNEKRREALLFSQGQTLNPVTSTALIDASARNNDLTKMLKVMGVFEKLNLDNLVSSSNQWWVEKVSKSLGQVRAVVEVPIVNREDIDGLEMMAMSFVHREYNLIDGWKLLGEYAYIILLKLEVESHKGVARDGLRVEVHITKIILSQKAMIYKCNIHGKPVITATQRLDSMIRFPRPTPAEDIDVSNAILDGSFWVLLRIYFIAESSLDCGVVFNKIMGPTPVSLVPLTCLVSTAVRMANSPRAYLIFIMIRGGCSAKWVTKYSSLAGYSMMVRALIPAFQMCCSINKFYAFSSPRPPEVADLEDKVNLKGGGMLRAGAVVNVTGPSSDDNDPRRQWPKNSCMIYARLFNGQIM